MVEDSPTRNKPVLPSSGGSKSSGPKMLDFNGTDSSKPTSTLKGINSDKVLKEVPSDQTVVKLNTEPNNVDEPDLDLDIDTPKQSKKGDTTVVHDIIADDKVPLNDFEEVKNTHFDSQTSQNIEKRTKKKLKRKNIHVSIQF